MVGLVDNRPSSNELQHFEEEERKEEEKYVGWTFSQNVSSLALTVWEK